MTDEQIIKALECCDGFQCDECPLYEYSNDPVICEQKCKQGSLDLINRQKAEIERLAYEKENLRCVIEDLSNNIEYAKAEAFKEFAERLKSDCISRIQVHPYTLKFWTVEEEDIDNLVIVLTSLNVATASCSVNANLVRINQSVR